MTFKYSLFLFVFLSIFKVTAQNTDTVLFTVEGTPIYTSEFLRVYNKNLDVLTDDSQKDIKNYLDLFVNYKLKVKQAIDFGLDTLPTYTKELASYKNQLIEPYLKDQSVVDSLVKQAYDRSLIEINASHILVMLNQATPNDTLKAFTKINEARAKIIEGASFEKVAIEYSEDPSVKRNNGLLGYFSAFSMVYPFENAAYSTKVGSVSQPFKTKYGYHIVKVNSVRNSLGEVEAAHIMIKGDSLSSETKINEIYKQLQQGEDFGYLAKTQSDDKYSAKKEGSLGRFGSGKMVKEFENVAFSLQNEGDFSVPFKTKFGWHIIKLVHKFPVASFEDSRDKIADKVKRGDRAVIVSNSIINKLKSEYDIVVNQDALDELNEKSNDISQFSKVVLTINDKSIIQKQLVNFLRGRVLDDTSFKSFLNQEVITYYKENLENTNAEFSNIYKEYKEGLLLFELLQRRIWDRSKDSIGVQDYFDAHKTDFVLPERIEGTIVSCNNKKSAKKVKKELKKGTSIDKIKEMINVNDEVHIIFKSGTFNKEDDLLPANYKLKIGVSDIFEVNSKYIIVEATSVLASEQQSLENVRGKVISDYQEVLEKEWIEELHATYNVQFNKENVEKVLGK